MPLLANMPPINCKRKYLWIQLKIRTCTLNTCFLLTRLKVVCSAIVKRFRNSQLEVATIRKYTNQQNIFFHQLISIVLEWQNTFFQDLLWNKLVSLCIFFWYPTWGVYFEKANSWLLLGECRIYTPPTVFDQNNLNF